MAIQIKRNASSSGSLIAVLNLTIERAPTRPSDNANDDFTTVMINIVVIVKRMKLLAKFFLLERDVP